MTVRLALLALFLAACGNSSTSMTKVEICNNGKDDDANGKTDCEDIDCSGQAGCPVIDTDAGSYGTCAKCGTECASQQQCLTKTFQEDNPPYPECIAGRCQLFSKNVQVALEIDTASLNGFSPPLRALNTRIISKTGLNGTAVICSDVIAAASGKTANDAAQLEKPTDGGMTRFNFRGYDVSPLQATGGQIIKQPFVNVATGSNYLIWTEIWGGPVDTLSKLPTGARYTWGCFESGAAVDPIVAADTCFNIPDGGFCKTIKVKLVNGPL